AGEYIQHHLTSLQFDLTTFSFNADASGFWVINVDTLFFSIVLGGVFLWLFYSVAARFTSDTPDGMQNFVELMYEFVDTQVRDIFHGDSKLIAPLALTIFVWIWLMIFMDLLRVSAVRVLAAVSCIDFLRIVRTADGNTIFGMSLSVLALVIFYSVNVKGAGGYARHLLGHPF